MVNLGKMERNKRIIRKFQKKVQRKLRRLYQKLKKFSIVEEYNPTGCQPRNETHIEKVIDSSEYMRKKKPKSFQKTRKTDSLKR